MSKQDGVFPRTPSALEQKYQFGKSFAEVMEIATDARKEADNANKSVEKLDTSLSAEEVYNRLTDNGKLQGLFRDEDGNLFVNAAYLYALEKLFAKDLTMTGKFTNILEDYIAPGEEEIEFLQHHILGDITIPAELFPLYDLNGDGQLDIVDIANMEKARLGIIPMANFPNANKTTVTMTIDLSKPDKAIRFTGTNMWGRAFDSYIGVNLTNITNSKVADYVVESGTEGNWTWEKWNSGKAVCWCTTEYKRIDYNTNWYNIAYYSNASYNLPSGLFFKTPTFAAVNTLSSVGLLENSITSITTDTIGWFAIDHITEPTSRDVKFLIEVKGAWK